MFRRKSAPRNLTGFWKTVIPHINVTSSVKVIGFPQVGNQSSVLYKGKFFCVRWFLFQFFSPLKSPSSNFPFFYISPLPSQLAEVSNSQIQKILHVAFCVLCFFLLTFDLFSSNDTRHALYVTVIVTF